MIEVRSALTARLLGHIPGRLDWPARVGDRWTVMLRPRYGDLIAKTIDLCVREFREGGAQYGWAALDSDGHPIDQLRKIEGWRDADSSPDIPQRTG